MSAPPLNGKPRKQLADQIDRLDEVIDALSVGLNGAVADACREGTRQAVRDAVLELVTNPDLRGLLVPAAPAGPVPPPAPNPPALWVRLLAALGATIRVVLGAIAGAAGALKAAVVARAATVTDRAGALGAAAGEAPPVRRFAAVTVLVGALAGAACSGLPEPAPAVLAGTGWALAAALVQAGAWVRRAARRAGLLG